MNKRGLSTVVTTLIIILLVFVAIGIVWVVVRNVISQGVEQISLGGLTINLEIKDVKINLDTIEINVKRNPGEGELSGIKFLVSDGVGTQVFEEETNMQELGERRFTLNYAGLVKEVSIAPILKSKSGKEIIGREIDKKVFSNKEIIKNLGAVSWWRFEGNAQDEIGGNNGVVNGAVLTTGKFGQAYEFKGDQPPGILETNQERITITNTPELEPTTQWSVTGWIYKKINIQTDNGAALFWKGNNQKISVEMINDGIRVNAGGIWEAVRANNVPNNQWVYVVVTYDNSLGNGNLKIYINGEEKDNRTGIVEPIPGSEDVWIGERGDHLIHSFKGIIDEVTIFNRALSEEEVKALYGLDLR